MKTKIAITLGAMALSAMSGAAYASSITQPGEQAGLALGAPLPEGVYFESTDSYGTARTLGDDGRAGLANSGDCLVNALAILQRTYRGLCSRAVGGMLE